MTDEPGSDTTPGRDAEPASLETQLGRYGQVLRDATSAGSVPDVPLSRSVPASHHRALLVAAAILVIVAGLGLTLVALHPTGTRVETATTSATAPTPARVDPHQLAAQASAADLARRMQVDPSWTAVATVPIAVLAQAPSTPGTPNLVTITRLWTSPASWTDTDAWIAAHPPAGLGVAGTGSLGDRSGTISRTSLHAPRCPHQRSSYRFDRELLVTTAPLTTGGTGIRMDVQVTWVPSRPAGAVVAEGMSAVSITVTWNGTSPQPPAPKTFTDRATIASLRRTVNGLSMSLPGVIHCPLDVGLRYTLRFTGAGRPTTTLVSGSCNETTLTVGATAYLTLSTGTSLLDQEARLLGTTTQALNNQAVQASTVPVVTPTTG